MKIVKKWLVLVGILGGVVFNDRAMIITVEDVDDNEPSSSSSGPATQDLLGFLSVPGVSRPRVRGYKKKLTSAHSGNIAKSIAQINAEESLNERFAYIRNAFLLQVPTEYSSDLTMILKGKPESPLFNQKAFDESMFKNNKMIADQIKEIQENSIKVANSFTTKSEFEHEFSKKVWYGGQEGRLGDSLLDKIMEVVRKERKRLAAGNAIYINRWVRGLEDREKAFMYNVSVDAMRNNSNGLTPEPLHRRAVDMLSLVPQRKNDVHAVRRAEYKKLKKEHADIVKRYQDGQLSETQFNSLIKDAEESIMHCYEFLLRDLIANELRLAVTELYEQGKNDQHARDEYAKKVKALSHVVYDQHYFKQIFDGVVIGRQEPQDVMQEWQMKQMDEGYFYE